LLRAEVSVFAHRYMKNWRLREQAPLRRSRLGETPEPAGTAQAPAEPVLAELSARLGAVDDLVTVLSGQAAGIPDAAVTWSLLQLEHRAGRLRDMVDAMRAGADAVTLTRQAIFDRGPMVGAACQG
jgi:hypothetical protein